MNESSSDTDEMDGGSGGLRLRKRGRADTKLLERAMREQWDIPDKYRDPIVNRQVQIAIDPNSGARESTSAAKCIVAMNKQNLDVAMKVFDKEVPDQIEVSHHVDVAAITAELEADPDYVEFQRHQSSKSDTDPRAVCQSGFNGDARTVADGEAHGSARPGTNGDSKGHE